MSDAPEFLAVVAAIDEEVPAACAKVDATYALARVEPDLIRELHLARLQRSVDGFSEIEGDQRAFAAYRAAVEGARVALLPLITPLADDVFLSQPRVTAALEARARADHGDVYVYPERLAGYTAAARKKARTAARSALDRAASACTDALVDRERGRWLAIFNGKA